MGEPQLIAFTNKEIVRALLKYHNIHEGIWSLTVQFGLKAGMSKVGPSEEDMVPTVIIPLLKFAIQRHDKDTPFTVNASEVNPPPEP